jgi:hypothetical protein
VRRDHLVNGTAKSCGCLQIEDTINRSWKGYEEISGKYWYDIHRNAKHRIIDFDITIEEAWELFIKQQKVCFYTGEPLCFSKGRRDKKLQTASLDRIDNTKGYSIENCCWVHKRINKLKGDFTEAEFLDWSKKITQYAELKSTAQTSSK